MSRRSSFKLLTDVDTHYEVIATETAPVEDIIWSSCFICQEDSSEKHEVEVEAKYTQLLNEIRRF